MARHRGIAWFASSVLGKKLYPYQEEIGDTIIESVLKGQGGTYTCMLSRQMGKNETSAIIEAYLLFCMDSGTLVKAAPT